MIRGPSRADRATVDACKAAAARLGAALGVEALVERDPSDPEQWLVYTCPAGSPSARTLTDDAPRQPSEHAAWEEAVEWLWRAARDRCPKLMRAHDRALCARVAPARSLAAIDKARAALRAAEEAAMRARDDVDRAVAQHEGDLFDSREADRAMVEAMVASSAAEQRAFFAIYRPDEPPSTAPMGTDTGAPAVPQEDDRT